MIKNNIRETVATFVASGIDPQKNIIFNQSQVSAHSEAAWILSCTARMGWLNRMTQFKEKAGKDLKYLLYNWLEEIIILTITDGFAGKRIVIDILKNENYEIHAEVFGEMINLKKHEFKVEIKSPTFHEMEIKEGDKIVMKYLLNL